METYCEVRKAVKKHYHPLLRTIYKGDFECNHFAKLVNIFRFWLKLGACTPQAISM